MSETDVHHLVAWQHGGATDIRNLTLLCRRHHVDNNDNQDFRNGMGHSERDPGSGRVGKRMPGADDLIFNESTSADESAAARYRRRAQERSSCSPVDEALFDGGKTQGQCPGHPRVRLTSEAGVYPPA